MLFLYRALSRAPLFVFFKRASWFGRSSHIFRRRSLPPASDVHQNHVFPDLDDIFQVNKILFPFEPKSAAAWYNKPQNAVFRITKHHIANPTQLFSIDRIHHFFFSKVVITQFHPILLFIHSTRTCPILFGVPRIFPLSPPPQKSTTFQHSIICIRSPFCACPHQKKERNPALSFFKKYSFYLAAKRRIVYNSSSITFYIINRLAIRERFVHFENYTAISNAISEQKQCLFFLKEKHLLLSSISIFVSPITDRNVLLGIDPKTGTAHAIPFQLITNAILQNEDSIPVKNNLKILRKAFLEFIKAEKILQRR